MTIGGVREARLLRALHDEHAGVLWAYVVRLTNGDRARAHDVVQETLLRAWRNPAVLDESRGSARGWLFTVARRIVIDEWRTARSHAELLTDQVPEGVADDDRADRVAEHVANRDVLVRALRTLSAEHRAVVAECYVRGASVAEAAVALGIPEGTVKSRAHYALRALRAAIEEQGGRP